MNDRSSLSRRPAAADRSAEGLEQHLKAAIAAGQWPVGGLLPTEVELCAETGLSRYAVRKAVGRLIDLGMVSRQQGIGTMVLSSRPQSLYTHTMSKLEELWQYASGTELKLSLREHIVVGTDARGELLESPAGTRWLRLSGVRFSVAPERQPISLVNIFVAGRFSNLKSLSNSPKTPIYQLVEQAYDVKVTRVEQRFNAEILDRQSAEALHVKSGSAGLLVTRRYFLGSELIEVTTGLHPAERYSYSMALDLLHG